MGNEYWQGICRQAVRFECDELYELAATAWKKAAGVTNILQYRQWDLARAKKCERLARKYGLTGRNRRNFRASESRQRAGAQRNENSR